MGVCATLPTAAAPAAWAGWGHSASWPAPLGATGPPAAWSAPAATTAPVSPPRAPAAAAPASTARPVSTFVLLASTGLAARGRASVSRELPATPSAASASVLPASTASSVRGGASRAHLERAATSSVTVRVGCPVTPSPATAFVPQGAWGPPVTLTAEGASSGRAVPCAVTAGVGLIVTPSLGSATVWTATQGPRAGKVGPPSSPRACPQPRAQQPRPQPLMDQRPGSGAGQRSTNLEAACAEACRPRTAQGTRDFDDDQGGTPVGQDSSPILVSVGCGQRAALALRGSSGHKEGGLAWPALQSLGEWTGPWAAQLHWPDPACAEEAHPSGWPGSGLRAAVGAATGAGMGPLPPKQVLLVLGP